MPNTELVAQLQSEIKSLKFDLAAKQAKIDEILSSQFKNWKQLSNKVDSMTKALMFYCDGKDNGAVARDALKD